MIDNLNRKKKRDNTSENVDSGNPQESSVAAERQTENRGNIVLSLADGENKITISFANLEPTEKINAPINGNKLAVNDLSADSPTFLATQTDCGNSYLAKNGKFAISQLPDWFDLNSISSQERSELSEILGDFSTSNTEEVYKTARNFIISAYYRNPANYLNFISSTLNSSKKICCR